MAIIDHGTWVLYRPDVLPVGAPLNTMFARRESDGVDWYNYVNDNRSFQMNSLKLTVRKWEEDGPTIVSAPTLDATMLFPAEHRVVEIPGNFNFTTDELIKEYATKVIDLATGTFSDAPFPAKQPRQKELEVLIIVQELKARLDKLESGAP